MSATSAPMKVLDVFDPLAEFRQAEVGATTHDQIKKRALSRVCRDAFINQRAAKTGNVFFKHLQGHFNVDFPLYIAAKAQINMMFWHG
ncbi:hypothetical protein PssiTeo3_52270 [Pseudomonas sichuanensis]|nr:hypothetical protein [Pseudomonas sichuanensis]